MHQVNQIRQANRRMIEISSIIFMLLAITGMGLSFPFFHKEMVGLGVILAATIFVSLILFVVSPILNKLEAKEGGIPDWY